MSRLSEYIGSQFGNPRGFVGRVCCLCMNVINKAMYMRTISYMKAKPEDKVLDIGYGNGFFLQKLYKKSQADLYGIDISEDMKRQATKRNKQAAACGKLHLQVGDCCKLPYEDDTFQAISSINTVYFWSDTVKGLTEIRRTLKKGANFYNVVYTKEWLSRTSYTEKVFKLFEAQELIRLGREAGFRKVAVRDIIKGRNYVVIYKK